MNLSRTRSVGINGSDIFPASFNMPDFPIFANSFYKCRGLENIFFYFYCW